MGNLVRDNIDSGEGNLSNRVYNKDSMLLDVGHQSKHQKQNEWHGTGIHKDPDKVLHQSICL